ncbi:hypothetical protein GGX14DRAFT_577266 [Mycena pura]|uniref:Uncharacterized protein n=1 Tax=Mycena pura TaxID=153505 RepID=A0AAD6US86_9AGAR|nr:hypothetical protein GGX14DRAFT_577266 [Mycena pura]
MLRASSCPEVPPNPRRRRPVRRPHPKPEPKRSLFRVSTVASFRPGGVFKLGAFSTRTRTYRRWFGMAEWDEHLSNTIIRAWSARLPAHTRDLSSAPLPALCAPVGRHSPRPSAAMLKYVSSPRLPGPPPADGALDRGLRPPYRGRAISIGPLGRARRADCIARVPALADPVPLHFDAAKRGPGLLSGFSMKSCSSDQHHHLYLECPQRRVARPYPLAQKIFLSRPCLGAHLSEDGGGPIHRLSVHRLRATPLTAVPAHLTAAVLFLSFPSGVSITPPRLILELVSRKRLTLWPQSQANLSAKLSNSC